MEWFKKIWNDPVWSKVIAGVILALVAAAYSVIKGWISDTETIPDVLLSVFAYKINIWIALIVFILALIISGVRSNKENDKLPMPPFVTGFTENLYIQHVWTWRWQWSETCNFYYMKT